MLRVLSVHSSKLCSRFCDVACHLQYFCTDSEAVPPHVSPLRRRRSLKRSPAQSPVAEHKNIESPRETDIDETEHLSRMQRIKQRQIFSADISADSLRHQLNDAVSSPQIETDLEFPSDVLANQELSKRDQGSKAFRPAISPLETSIVMFPGESSQFVGMGAKLLAYPGVEKIYKTASNILGYNLLDVCLYGPKDVLSKTIHSQPGVLVTSLAAVEKLKEVCPQAISNCISAAGYGVGEYAALVFAGAMSFEDAVRVVKIRAAAMQSAANLIPSGMIKVHYGASGKVGKACHLAKEYCKQELNMTDIVCAVSTYLYPECKIISGNQEALEFIERNRREFGINRIERLPVAGAFHCRLMHSTLSSLSRALAATDIHEPLIPVHCNVTGHRYRTAVSIRQHLVNQLWKPLQWEQTMHVLYGRPVGHEFPLTFEVGPGKQLGYLLQKVNAKAYAQYDHIQV